jgi:hypothetical protein
VQYDEQKLADDSQGAGSFSTDARRGSTPISEYSSVFADFHRGAYETMPRRRPGMADVWPRQELDTSLASLSPPR